MTITYIAFIECVLHPDDAFQRIENTSIHYPRGVSPNSDVYKSRGTNSEIRLVDIKNDRRYFRFLYGMRELRIVNNTVVFDSDDVEEVSIDDSKKFPNKKRMDE